MMLLDKIDTIYNKSAVSYELYQIQDHSFELFSKAVSKLDKFLKDEEPTGLLDELIRKLKRVRFRHSSTPLSFCNRHNDIKLSERVQELIPNLRHAYPGIEIILLRLEKILKICEENNRNKFLDWIIKYQMNNPDDKIAILPCDGRYCFDSEQIIEKNINSKTLSILNQKTASSIETFDTIIVLGSVNWVSESIYNSPRASKIITLNYSWIPCVKKIESLLSAYNELYKKSTDIKFIINTEIKTIIEKEDDTLLDVIIEINEIAPNIKEEVLRNRPSIKGFDEDEIEESNPIVLSSNQMTFVGNSKVKTIEINIGFSSNDFTIKDKQISELSQGDLVVFKSSRDTKEEKQNEDDDYVLGIANSLLGSDSRRSKLREIQQEYKTLLKNKLNNVYKHNYKRWQLVSTDLKHYGALNPSPQNIRNWINPRKIKPLKFSDFNAIMNYIGLKDKSASYWSSLVEIDKAHKLAGKKASELLLKKLNETNLNNIYNTGYQEIKLGLPGCPSLGIYRIEHIIEEKVHVHFSSIGKVIKIKDF
jgi:hypothetical protein